MERKPQLQRKDEQLDEQKEEIEVTLAEIDKKDQQLRSQEREMTNLQIALTQKVDEIGLLQKEVFFLKRKPLDKKTEKQWWEALHNGDEETVKDILARY
ncbi:MAG: hypothetical protein AAF443_09045, partial [Chlamydiota bacterium]